jgi:hypothetical protein
VLSLVQGLARTPPSWSCLPQNVTSRRAPDDLIVSYTTFLSPCRDPYHDVRILQLLSTPRVHPNSAESVAEACRPAHSRARMSNNGNHESAILNMCKKQIRCLGTFRLHETLASARGLGFENWKSRHRLSSLIWEPYLKYGGYQFSSIEYGTPTVVTKFTKPDRLMMRYQRTSIGRQECSGVWS